MLKRYKKILIPLFYRIRELEKAPLEKRLLALNIQEELLKRIINAESLIQRIRVQNKLIKKQLSQRSNTREIAQEIRRRYKSSDDKIARQKFLLWIYRTIGDSIAFIYGNRWDLKQYAMKESAGFIKGKKGTRLERASLRKAFSIGATVVMNDLTNTLRHGDISIFRPDLWPNGGSPFLLMEAKSGKGGDKERTNRQLEAIKKITEYLSTDKRIVENGTYMRVGYKTPPQHHFDVVARLSESLLSKRQLIEEVEPGLSYLMIDSSLSADSVDEILSALISKDKKYFILSVNDMKEQSHGYFPFPLCLEPKTLFRFYNGEFVMFILADIDHINKILARKKLILELTELQELPFRIVLHSGAKNEAEFYVGWHIIGRLAAEFLSLDWFIKNVIDMGAGTLLKQLKLQSK